MEPTNNTTVLAAYEQIYETESFSDHVQYMIPDLYRRELAERREVDPNFEASFKVWVLVDAVRGIYRPF